MGVPLTVAALAAGVTAAVSCDTNGLGVLVAAAGAAFALGWWWAAHCGARRWWRAGAMLSAGAVGSVAAAASWAAVALDRCFTF